MAIYLSLFSVYLYLLFLGYYRGLPKKKKDDCYRITYDYNASKHKFDRIHLLDWLANCEIVEKQWLPLF